MDAIHSYARKNPRIQLTFTTCSIGSSMLEDWARCFRIIHPYRRGLPKLVLSVLKLAGISLFSKKTAWKSLRKATLRPYSCPRLGRFGPQLAIDLRLEFQALCPSKAATVGLGAHRRQRRGAVDAMTLGVSDELHRFRQELREAHGPWHKRWLRGPRWAGVRHDIRLQKGLPRLILSRTPPGQGPFGLSPPSPIARRASPRAPGSDVHPGRLFHVPLQRSPGPKWRLRPPETMKNIKN